MNVENIKSFFVLSRNYVRGIFYFLPNSWRQCVPSLWEKESLDILWFYFSLRVHLLAMEIGAGRLSFVSTKSHKLYHETGPAESPWIM